MEKVHQEKLLVMPVGLATRYVQQKCKDWDGR